MQDGGISYRALVGDTTVACWFTWEALQDVNPEFSQETPMNQFLASQDQLLAIARDKILKGHTAGTVVHIGKNDV
jgi:hypothetical protein